VSVLFLTSSPPTATQLAVAVHETSLKIADGADAWMFFAFVMAHVVPFHVSINSCSEFELGS